MARYEDDRRGHRALTRRVLVLAAVAGCATLATGLGRIASAQPTIDPDNCASIKAGIEYDDQQIRNLSNLRSEQQRFIEHRTSLVQLHNAKCLGGASTGGYAPPSTAQGALGLAATFLGMMADAQQRRQAEASERTRIQDYQRQLDRERRQREELERRAEAKAADDKRRRALCNPFPGGTCEGGPETSSPNPFAVASATATNPFAQQRALEESNANVANCKAKYNPDDRGEGVDGLPACPTDQELARRCKIDGIENGSLAAGAIHALSPCVQDIDRRTAEPCSLHRLRQDLRYKLTINCLNAEARRLANGN